MLTHFVYIVVDRRQEAYGDHDEEKRENKVKMKKKKKSSVVLKLG